ncbi:MAG: hypothetical protein AAF288_12440 [Planctomycetota bacterium]
MSITCAWLVLVAGLLAVGGAQQADADIIPSATAPDDPGFNADNIADLADDAAAVARQFDETVSVPGASIAQVAQAARRLRETLPAHHFDGVVARHHEAIYKHIVAGAFGAELIDQGKDIPLPTAEQALAASSELADLHDCLRTSLSVQVFALAQAAKVAALSQVQSQLLDVELDGIGQLRLLLKRLAWDQTYVESLQSLAGVDASQADEPREIVLELYHALGADDPGSGRHLLAIMSGPEGYAGAIARQDVTAIVTLAIRAEQWRVFNLWGALDYIMAGGAVGAEASEVRRVLSFEHRQALAVRSLWPKQRFGPADLYSVMESKDRLKSVAKVLSMSRSVAEQLVERHLSRRIDPTDLLRVDAGRVYLGAEMLEAPYIVAVSGDAVVINKKRAFVAPPAEELGIGMDDIGLVASASGPHTFTRERSLGDPDVANYLLLQRYGVMRINPESDSPEILLAAWARLPFIASVRVSDQDKAFLICEPHHGDALRLRWQDFDPEILRFVSRSRTDWLEFRSANLRSRLRQGEVWVIMPEWSFSFTRVQWSVVEPVIEAWLAGEVKLPEAVSQVKRSSSLTNDQHLSVWLQALKSTRER